MNFAFLVLGNSGKLTLQSPELWVYLLGLSVLLVIVLRRVLAQQTPLKDEVYMKTVAIEYVQSGVAWIRADGTIRSINASLAATLGAEPSVIVGRDWQELFALEDRNKMEEAYRQMLLLGKATLEVRGMNACSGLEARLVAIHNHKMRFVGHYCLVLDRTREWMLAAQLEELGKNLEQQQVGAVR